MWTEARSAGVSGISRSAIAMACKEQAPLLADKQIGGACGCLHEKRPDGPVCFRGRVRPRRGLLSVALQPRHPERALFGRATPCLRREAGPVE